MPTTGWIARSAYTYTIGKNISAAANHYWACVWAAAMARNRVANSYYRLSIGNDITRTAY
jgi:hypothetical protein